MALGREYLASPSSAPTPPDRRDSSPRFHDESRMPVVMGTPYRVPQYAYSNWGITYQGEEQADEAYSDEWAAGDSGQLGFVGQATVEAGLGDFPDLLNGAASRAIAELVGLQGKPLRILDVGSGPGKSTLAIHKSLPYQVSNDVEYYLIDPSQRSLDAADELLTKNGVRSFQTIKGSDNEVIPELPDNSFDVVIGVASVHHHARIPFEQYTRVLKKGEKEGEGGGFLILADWHQGLWEHPGSVRWFLEQMDWPKKEEGLANWDKTYPQAVGYGDPRERYSNPADVKAIEQITAFWSAYQEIQNREAPGANAIWPLEGHRPVARYVEDMQRAGLHLGTPKIEHLLGRGIRSNPHQILPDSSLLQLTIGQKI